MSRAGRKKFGFFWSFLGGTRITQGFTKMALTRESGRVKIGIRRKRRIYIFLKNRHGLFFFFCHLRLRLSLFREPLSF